MRRLLSVVSVSLAALVVAAPATAFAAGANDPPAPVEYRPPLDAPLVDTFRPPASDYGAGNRGIDYGTQPGEPVAAAAAGEVVFAGQVGTSRHVVVLHADGIRTSYSFLGSTGVRRGDRVEAGDVVGTAGPDPVHFGARAGDAYVDPLVLLGQRPAGAGEGAVLVADPDDRRPLAESVEREHLRVDVLDRLRKVVAWADDKVTTYVSGQFATLEALADTALELSIPLPWYVALAVVRWERLQGQCTPAATPVPIRPAAGPPRHVALLVGGLGSSTGRAAVLHVDAAQLGYAAGDVHQFTYAADPTAPYGAADTMGDIDVAGARLARQVDDLRRAEPGAVIDVIAHSEGGLVARSAITTHHATPATVVTLGTPHQGADLATVAVIADGFRTGHAALAAVGDLTEGAFDPTSPAVQQMSETSRFLDALPETGWPATTHVVSIAARGDSTVPSHRSRLEAEPPAAYNAVVSVDGKAGITDHAGLPGSPEATDELARAIAHQAPTCRSLQDTIFDEMLSRDLSASEDRLAIAVAVAGVYLDKRTGLLPPKR